MLLFLVALLVWLPALAGWALPWAMLRQRLGGPKLQTFDGSDGIAALAVLAALSVLLNFVLPLTSLVSGLVVLVGWLLLAWRWAAARPPRLPLRVLVGAAVGLSAI